MKWTSCEECGTPCAYYSGSFYRCRQCGYESISGAVPSDLGTAAYIVATVADDGFAARVPAASVSEQRGPVQLGLSLFSTREK